MIGPISAFEAFFFRAFNITGRASRAEFWWVFLFLFFAGVAALVWDVMTLMSSDVPATNPFAYMTPVLMLLTFVPNLTLTMRRLHDTGRSSLWFMISFVPVIGVLILYVLLAMPGQKDDNKWGAPRGPASGGGSPLRSGGKAHDPWQSYSVLFEAERVPSPEEEQARREQIREYYRTKVLKQTPTRA
ncbi:DUF805 domain-containing protein [Thalassococcus sp. CAU 1522]|uniref:DUF805 domain-containing protein n=1 Tax=Thalassococcus arenae TaxID=2851652 RepID=A0ABS6N8N0_9RHOB|nr:DUF805 domain-containing protein [Thalassococcus arenae]MBV2360163.1 DUF805 domain-containing protein [Thalassococcus arenae]